MSIHVGQRWGVWLPKQPMHWFDSFDKADRYEFENLHEKFILLARAAHRPIDLTPAVAEQAARYLKKGR